MPSSCSSQTVILLSTDNPVAAYFCYDKSGEMSAIHNITYIITYIFMSVFMTERDNYQQRSNFIVAIVLCIPTLIYPTVNTQRARGDDYIHKN